MFGGGILATALRETLCRAGLEADVRPRTLVDVCDAQGVRDAVASSRADALVNAAAYTKVDAAEDDRASAFLTNAMAPGLCARAAREAGIPFVHVSTDFVFDGEARRPYREDDPPRPLSVYGMTKLQGEMEAQREDPGALVVRTSWHYGPGGPNFVRAIRDRIASGKPLSVVTDQRGRPTYSANLSWAILELLRCGARGTYHYADRVEQGSLSWFDFARGILERSGLPEVPMNPTTSAELGRKAPRPTWSVLDTSRFEQTTGRTPPRYEEGLSTYLGELSAVVSTP